MIPLFSSYYYRSGSAPVPTTIGNLFTRDYTSGNYATIGSPTVTFGASSIQVGGGANNFSRRVEWNPNIIDCENFTVTGTITIDSIGIAPILSFSGLNCKLYFYFLCGTGELVILNESTDVSNPTGQNMGACSNGDIITWSISVIGKSFILNMSKNTGGAGLKTTSWTSADFNYNFSNAIPGAIKIGFGTYSGTYTFTWENPTTTDETLSDLFILGTSKTKGYFAGGTDINARVDGLWAAANPTKRIFTSAGVNETTVHMLSKLYELAKYLPKRVLISDISNDQRFGTATTSANLTSIRDYVINTLGSQIYIQRPIPEYVPNGGTNLAPLDTIIDTVFAPSEIIAVPGTWAAATDNAADGIHWINQSKIYNQQALTITL